MLRALIVPCLFLIFQPLNAKVEAPNYHFSVDTLKEFAPGADIKIIEEKYGKGSVEGNRSGVRTLKFFVSHIRYKFPVLVQEKEGLITDMYARLPGYFLHDVFFQSLVNRLGKQDHYKKIGEHAQYVWKKDDFLHTYEGACTITCFPIFYAVEKKEAQVKSILRQMRDAAKN